MRKFISLLLLFLVALATPSVTNAASKAPVWEIISQNENTTNRTENRANENIDVDVRDGMVYITVDAPVKVEIFSILGQLITSRQLNPGTVRLTLSQRGVYILKGASVTRRINI
ncbi:MAG: hypothetical protein K2I69_00525 [Muribaculaceae bacterium]|nr:hypothetical protein [Muribaculaceae bacterium]